MPLESPAGRFKASAMPSDYLVSSQVHIICKGRVRAVPCKIEDWILDSRKFEKIRVSIY